MEAIGDALAQIGLPSLVGLVVWVLTRNDREAHDDIARRSEALLDRCERDGRYWRARALRAERALRQSNLDVPPDPLDEEPPKGLVE